MGQLIEIYRHKAAIYPFPGTRFASFSGYMSHHGTGRNSPRRLFIFATKGAVICQAEGKTGSGFLVLEFVTVCNTI